MCDLIHKVDIGIIDNKKIIDELRIFVFNNFKEELKARPSFHKYIIYMSKDFQKLVKKIKNSQQIHTKICSQYLNCDITQLDNTDELYVSHYNMDKGGDQGLYDKHYDGVLRFIKDATIVRVLVYINSNDDFIVHFEDSKISHNFKTYEYGILDFNKEYHWVEGKYDKSMNVNDTRMLLKLNYLICPKCTPFYTKLIISLNNSVFTVVKMSMEYSKSPKNIFQYIIGFFCNLFRVVNNVSVYLVFILILILFYILFLSLQFVTRKILYKK